MLKIYRILTRALSSSFWHFIAVVQTAIFQVGNTSYQNSVPSSIQISFCNSSYFQKYTSRIKKHIPNTYSHSKQQCHEDVIIRRKTFGCGWPTGGNSPKLYIWPCHIPVSRHTQQCCAGAFQHTGSFSHTICYWKYIHPLWSVFQKLKTKMLWTFFQVRNISFF